MHLKNTLVAFVLLIQIVIGAKQLSAQTNTEIKSSLKGTFYISWGYNREGYTNSDIRFKNNTNDNYDFTIVNAPAHDRPGFNNGLADFLSKDLTIPQYNLHIGYLFNDKHDLGIEWSWDHFKYIVADNTVLHLQGNIRGRQIDMDTFVSSNFVHLQHTNGNNYMMVSLVKKHKFYQNKYVVLSGVGKAGIGPLVSYTMSTVLGQYYDTWFRIQGFVVGGSIAARLDICKYLFIQPNFHLAWADYTSTPIGLDGAGRATHVFGSYAFVLEGGFNVPFGKK